MKNQIDKENVHWTPSSTARRAQPPKRPKRKFALVAIPSTLVVCGIATGLVLVGMNQKQGEGLVEATKAVTTAMAQPESASAKNAQAENKTTSPRLAGENRDGQNDVRATATPEPLSQHHPRWAEQAGTTDDTTGTGETLKRKLVRLGHEDMKPTSARTASIDSDVSSAEATASIPGQTAYAEVPVTDKDDEVAALEAIIAPEEPKRESRKESEAAGPEPVSWDAHATNLQTASATDAVHLRAQPGTDGEILTVVPEGASVEAESDCAGWCAVSYNGNKGWVYKDFVRFGQGTASRTASQAQPDAAAAPAEAAAKTEDPLPAPAHAPTTLDRTRNAR